MARKVKPEYEVGATIRNNKVDATIIAKEIRFIKEKYDHGRKERDAQRLFYHCHCNKCDNNYWKRKADILDHGCPICSKNPLVVVKGYNDFATHHKELLDYFVDINDAYTHSSMSSKKVKLKCPICGFKKSMPLSDFVVHGFACAGCSDGISYPEKFVVSLLRQINIDFVYQLSKTNFDWCGQYRYDFYLPAWNAIVEVHGGQHYEELNCGYWKSPKDEDKKKKDLALRKGFNYIEIDARESDNHFIKNSILKSELSKLLDLSAVDWDKCHSDALSSNVKKACDLWNTGLTTGEIAEQMSITIKAVQNYLTRGALVDLCDYTSDAGTRRALDDRRNKRGRRMVVYQNGLVVGRFNSIQDLEEQSLGLFGIQFSHPRISEAIRGVRSNPYAKYGYVFVGLNKEKRIS